MDNNNVHNSVVLYIHINNTHTNTVSCFLVENLFCCSPYNAKFIFTRCICCFYVWWYFSLCIVLYMMNFFCVAAIIETRRINICYILINQHIPYTPICSTFFVLCFLFVIQTFIGMDKYVKIISMFKCRYFRAASTK